MVTDHSNSVYTHTPTAFEASPVEPPFVFYSCERLESLWLFGNKWRECTHINIVPHKVVSVRHVYCGGIQLQQLEAGKWGTPSGLANHSEVLCKDVGSDLDAVGLFLESLPIE